MNYAKESNACSEEYNSSKESTNLRASLFTLPPLWSLQTISVVWIHCCRHRGIAELILSSVPFLPLMGFTMMRLQFPVSPKSLSQTREDVVLSDLELLAAGSSKCCSTVLVPCCGSCIFLMFPSNAVVLNCNNQNSPIQCKQFWILALFDVTQSADTCLWLETTAGVSLAGGCKQRATYTVC